MKKKIFSLSVFMLAITSTFAQLELKFEPISLIFGQVPLSAEYVIRDNMGIEVSARYSFDKPLVFTFEDITKSDGLAVCGLFKFYFNPDKGGDKFYAFPYVRYFKLDYDFTYNNNSGNEVSDKGSYKVFGFGFGAGYKVVSKNGIIFDFNAGVGKNISGEFIYPGDYPDDDKDDFFPVNGFGRISIGYRFGGVKERVETE